MHNGKEKMEQSVAGRAQKKKMRSEWTLSGKGAVLRALDDPALAEITILAMTANAFEEDKKKALECGMDGFLSKPIVIEELISTLQRNLN